MSLVCLSEWRGDWGPRHVQAAFMCPKEDRIHRQTLLLWHRGGGEVRGQSDWESLCFSWMMQRFIFRLNNWRCCCLVELGCDFLFIQTWRHYSASPVRGQQTALDGGNGWKRACKNTPTSIKNISLGGNDCFGTRKKLFIFMFSSVCADLYSSLSAQ